ncbi:metabotropic glutamate receptor 3 [Hydra vulgaris]|uniref:Metabotropic glutamate receptor 3 n=1 Tax=Hydra vulgaris TaxID=6087 RepID=A0ABM4B885_HYDVU
MVMPSICKYQCFFFIIFMISNPICCFGIEKKSLNVLIGGFFPVCSEKNCSKLCGKINIERGVHRVVAMLFAIDEINANDSLFPNFKIQPQIYDTCNQDSKALDGALDVVKIKNKQNICGSSEPVGGVIGPSSSSASIEVAKLLRLFQIPQISYAASSPLLSDRTKFNYFLRTVPSDSEAIKVIIAVAEYFQWSSVSVLYSEGPYGESLFETLQQLTERKNLCIVKQMKVNNNSNYTSIIEKLQQPKNTKAVLLLCTDNHILNIIRNASYLNASFSWLSLDFWLTNKSFLQTSKIPNAAKSVIIVRQSVAEQKKFEEYFYSSSFLNNKQNNWLKEIWEESFNCNITLNTCDLSNIIFDSKISYVIDAVYAFAYAFNKALNNSNNDLNSDVLSNGSSILNKLTNNFYNGSFGYTQFNEFGYTFNGYEIMQIQNDQYVKIGTFHDRLIINGSQIVLPFKSNCSERCAYNARKVVGTPSCCFTCETCPPNKIGKNEVCEECPTNQTLSDQAQSCIPISIKFISRTLVIIISVLASIGVVTTVFVSLIFVYYRRTDVVISSVPELSFSLLFGILLCYVLTYFMIADQTKYICYIQKFGISLSFCICYGSLLLKAFWFASSLYNNKTSKKGTVIPIATSQFFYLSSVILFQLVISFVQFYQTGKDKPLESVSYNGGMIIICSFSDSDFLASFIYNFILIFVCTVYAFRTRKVPLSFNEAKYIGFLMYASIILWVCFIPAYITRDDKVVQMITLSMNIPLHATSILATIFGPKVYFILTRRNQRGRSFSSYLYADNGNSSQQGSSSTSDQISRVTLTTQLSSDVL